MKRLNQFKIQSSKFKIKTALVTVVGIFSGSQNAFAAYNNTEAMAQNYCNQLQPTAIASPYYMGSRNAVDMWLCTEASMTIDESFRAVYPGPYAVLSCDRNKCTVVDWMK
ncbi:MAG: hypothetical protein ACRC11_09455 [Xenococcaceae cyanobacterium]